MKIAFLTAGGLAPCLSASIGALIEAYEDVKVKNDYLGYLHGFRGLLLGNSIQFSNTVINNTNLFYAYGGSPIGNSRVKLTNTEDCIEKGYIKAGEEPLHIAAKQLINDEIDVLHTIGGDDTNTMAAELAEYMHDIGNPITVVGLPKTVDNDIIPVKQTLGAWTAAEQGAVFFENIVNENTTSTRQLIIHEVMGRHCGWLTAETARIYRQRLSSKQFLPEINLSQERWDVDAVYIPEMGLNIRGEVRRLTKLMDEKDGVNIFLSEGAGIGEIISEMEGRGEEVPRDAFGHVKLDLINPGKWFAGQFAKDLNAEKILVQKSGYFARSAAPNQADLDLIKDSAALAVKYASDGRNGLVGQDDKLQGKLALIDFDRIHGGKPFDIDQEWFDELLADIGQPKDSVFKQN
ncbi:MAG: pyrophosphate--fructose-6-phosphate 1-phosphotransferase [Candidatus Neomarinimicrobiota bacterium]